VVTSATPLAVSVLMLLQAQGSEPRLMLEGRGVSLAAEAIHVDGEAVFPLTLLGVFGPEVRHTGNGMELLLLGDTLRVEPPNIYLVHAERWQRLVHGSYRLNGELFVPEEFLTRWLVERHPHRLRYASRNLRLKGDAGWAKDAPVSDVPRPKPDVWARMAPPRSPPAEDDDDESVSGSLAGFVDVRLSTVYDTNIDHEAVPVASHGGIVRLATGLQTARSDPFLRAEYQLAVHRFPNADSDRWNRVTHDANVELLVPLGRALELLVGGEMRLGAHTEDLERVNQFTVYPELEVRFSREVRFGVYAAQRMRRYAESIGRDVTNQLVGAELQHRWGASRGRWRLGGRYERNESDWEPHRFRRLRGRLTLEAPLRESTLLALTGEYSWRRYEARIIDLDADEVLRTDRRWTPSAYLSQRLGGRRWELRLGYEYEYNQSNDSAETYRAHRMEFMIRCRL